MEIGKTQLINDTITKHYKNNKYKRIKNNYRVDGGLMIATKKFK